MFDSRFPGSAQSHPEIQTQSFQLFGKKHTYQIMDNGFIKVEKSSHKKQFDQKSQLITDTTFQLTKTRHQPIQINDDSASSSGQPPFRKRGINFNEYLPQGIDQFYDDDEIGVHDLGDIGLNLKKCQQSLRKSNKQDDRTLTYFKQDRLMYEDDEKFNKRLARKQFNDLIEVEQNQYLAYRNGRKKLKKNYIQQYSEGATKIKVISQTQQEYQKQKSYLRKEYMTKAINEHNASTKTIQICEESESVPNSEDPSSQICSESNIEKLKIKLGLIRRINEQKSKIIETKSKGREFIPAPQYKLVPKKIHEYPPPCLAPEFGKYDWPPKKSEYRIWKRQTWISIKQKQIKIRAFIH